MVRRSFSASSIQLYAVEMNECPVDEGGMGPVDGERNERSGGERKTDQRIETKNIQFLWFPAHIRN